MRVGSRVRAYLSEQLLNIEVCFGRSNDVAQVKLVAHASDGVFLELTVFFVSFVDRYDDRSVLS